MNFETIKRNYDRKLWSASMVKMAVRKGYWRKVRLIRRATHGRRTAHREITGDD